jgi:hypothetical protein
MKNCAIVIKKTCVPWMMLELVRIPEDANLNQEITRLELDMCHLFDELDRKLVIG